MFQLFQAAFVLFQVLFCGSVCILFGLGAFSNISALDQFDSCCLHHFTVDSTTSSDGYSQFLLLLGWLYLDLELKCLHPCRLIVITTYTCLLVASSSMSLCYYSLYYLGFILQCPDGFCQVKWPKSSGLHWHLIYDNAKYIVSTQSTWLSYWSMNLGNTPTAIILTIQ